MKLIESVYDVKTQQKSLRRRRYGVIEAAQGKLVRIQLRPWPKFGSHLEAHWLTATKSFRQRRDTCRLFYNEPIGHPGFLSLAFAESSQRTSIRTIFATLNVLDQIAYLKNTNAIVGEVNNKRISDRALRHWGWERHMEHSRKRHWIKRFYGNYPQRVTQLLRPNFEKALKNHLGHGLPVQAGRTIPISCDTTET